MTRLGTEQVLAITLREMRAIGEGWRIDYSGFDGRDLRNQLNRLADWAAAAARDDDVELDYRAGTDFLTDQQQ